MHAHAHANIGAYVCIYVPAWTDMSAPLSRCTYVYIIMYLCICICIHRYLSFCICCLFPLQAKPPNYICIYIYTDVCVCIYIYMHVCMYIYIYICMNVCLLPCTFLHARLYTSYTSTYTRARVHAKSRIKKSSNDSHYPQWRIVSNINSRHTRLGPRHTANSSKRAMKMR